MENTALNQEVNLALYELGLEQVSPIQTEGINAAFSGAEIFIKTYQPNFRTRAFRDVWGGNWYNVPTIRPLVQNVIELSEGWSMSIWPLVSITPVQKCNLDEMVEILHKLHDQEISPGNRASTDWIESHKNEIPDRHFDHLHEMVEKYHQMTSGMLLHPVHGDSHAKNFGVHNGRVVLLDWELTGLEVSEWDWASLTQDDFSATRARELSLQNRPVLDWIVATRAFMTGSVHLLYGEPEIARQKSQGYHKILPTKAAQELDRILFDG